MEIDITEDVAGRAPQPPARLFRFAVPVALVAGVVIGAGFGYRFDRGGEVVLTYGKLTTAGGAAVLKWGLANFGTEPARVRSVLVDDVPVDVGEPEVVGRSAADFTTPVRCDGTVPPRMTVAVDGSADLEYMPDAAEWREACRAPSLSAPAGEQVLTQVSSQAGPWRGTAQAGPGGTVNFRMVCVGGGEMRVAYDTDAGGATFEAACDGETTSAGEANTGRLMKIDVTPRGGRRWSLLVTRSG